MRLATRAAAIILALVLVAAGAMKFTTGHVFQYLEYQTGLGVLHPFVNNLVGVAEIIAGLLILFRRTRGPGSLVALAIAAGAVVAHLTPWLGISPPTGLVDGAAAPWTAADFTAETSPGLFATAIVSLTLAAIVARPELRARRRPHAAATAPDDALEPQPA